MTSVLAGSRLRVEGAQSSVVVRSLRAVDLDHDWVVPVLADVALLDALTTGDEAAGDEAGHVEARRVEAMYVVVFPTAAGPVRLDAELVHDGAALLLRAPGLRTAAFTEQRRENVRGTVHLKLRGTVLAGGETEATMSQGLEGVTASVSAGGISAELESGSTMMPGARIYVELSMPGGDLAPAVLSVLECQESLVRAQFIDISPLDRERLVRLVFARQRAELAQRRAPDA